SAAIQFLTGTATPCTSVFKPLWVDTPAAWPKTAASERFDPESLFWRHERLHRLAIGDYAHRINVYAPEREGLEVEFMTRALSTPSNDQAARETVAHNAFERAWAAEQAWCRAILKDRPKNSSGLCFNLAWQKRNKKAGFPV
ncbi:MAG: hypothetical protein JJV98_18145, partial [Desulfosarcina sp.]|nr:hypothetical protein [Desulfobacterales bacterium]